MSAGDACPRPVEASPKRAHYPRRAVTWTFGDAHDRSQIKASFGQLERRANAHKGRAPPLGLTQLYIANGHAYRVPHPRSRPGRSTTVDRLDVQVVLRGHGTVTRCKRSLDRTLLHPTPRSPPPIWHAPLVVLGIPTINSRFLERAVARIIAVVFPPLPSEREKSKSNESLKSNRTMVIQSRTTRHFVFNH